MISHTQPKWDRVLKKALLNIKENKRENQEHISSIEGITSTKDRSVPDLLGLQALCRSRLPPQPPEAGTTSQALDTGSYFRAPGLCLCGQHCQLPQSASQTCRAAHCLANRVALPPLPPRPVCLVLHSRLTDISVPRWQARLQGPHDEVLHFSEKTRSAGYKSSGEWHLPTCYPQHPCTCVMSTSPRQVPLQTSQTVSLLGLFSVMLSVDVSPGVSGIYAWVTNHSNTVA